MIFNVPCTAPPNAVSWRPIIQPHVTPVQERQAVAGPAAWGGLQGGIGGPGRTLSTLNESSAARREHTGKDCPDGHSSKTPRGGAVSRCGNTNVDP